jgi:hypothetical protein
MLTLLIFSAPSDNSDQVVPVLFALVFLTLGAAIGGRIMAWLKQPAVPGELLVGLLAGNLGYYFGNAGLTALREGDNVLYKPFIKSCHRVKGASCHSAWQRSLA